MPRIPHGKVITTDDVENARRAMADVDAGPFAFAVAAPRTCRTSTTSSRPAERPGRVAARVGGHRGEPQGAGLDDGRRRPARPGRRTARPRRLHLLRAVRRPRRHPRGRLRACASGGRRGPARPDHGPAVAARGPNARSATLRTATLDLDSVYGPPARRHPPTPDRMLVGTVSDLQGARTRRCRPPARAWTTTCPGAASPDIAHDRAALIGDPRNDENTDHRPAARRVPQGAQRGWSTRACTLRAGPPDAAPALPARRRPRLPHAGRRPGRRRRRVANGNRWYRRRWPSRSSCRWSSRVAGYRFGHTMVRSGVRLQPQLPTAARRAGRGRDLELLFTFTALSGQLGFGTADDTLPDELDHRVGAARSGTARARGSRRRLDTRLAHAPATGRRCSTCRPSTVSPSRGWPPGWRCATCCAATGSACRVLAEAAAGGGAHLGAVGSTIVAEVLVGLVHRSDDSILRSPPGGPSRCRSSRRAASSWPTSCASPACCSVARRPGSTSSWPARPCRASRRPSWATPRAGRRSSRRTRAVVRRFDRISPAWC